MKEQNWKEIYKQDLERYPERVYDFDICIYHCRLKRQWGGYWCGYVQIPNEHPLYGEKCDNINVHGGITYHDIDIERNYWIGFDCSHMNDISPHSELTIQHMTKIVNDCYFFEYFNKTYKTYEYAKSELEKLVFQLSTHTAISSNL